MSLLPAPIKHQAQNELKQASEFQKIHSLYIQVTSNLLLENIEKYNYPIICTMSLNSIFE